MQIKQSAKNPDNPDDSERIPEDYGEEWDKVTQERRCAYVGVSIANWHRSLKNDSPIERVHSGHFDLLQI